MKMNRLWSLQRICHCLAIGAALGAMPNESEILDVMRHELDRNLEHLQLEGLNRPFFIAYRVTDSDGATASASFGVLSQLGSIRRREVRVEVLVGDHRVAGRGASGQSATREDPDGQQLRHALWLGTDSAYKNALSSLARRNSTLQAQRRQSMANDFSDEEPHVHFQETVAKSASAEQVMNAVRTISEGFIGISHIDYSLARAGSAASRTHYVNSEGSSFVSSRGESFVFGYARASSEDGTTVDDFFASVRPSWEEISDEEELSTHTNAIEKRLALMREAEETVRYLGPVLLEGQAVAELIAQKLAGRLISRPSDSAGMGMDNAPEFNDEIGSQILPEFLSLVDDPTIKEFEGSSLIGSYSIDMDAVPARRKILVDNGKLSSLLAGRRPTDEVERSTGNRRKDGVLPSNLFIEVRGGLSKRALRKRMLRMARRLGLDHAIVVQRISNPRMRTSVFWDPDDAKAVFEGQLGTTIQATRIYLDGSEVPIRKASLNIHLLRDIVAASKHRTLFEIPVSPYRQQLLADPSHAVAIVVPDLLFEEVSVRTPQGHVPNPYPVPHPLSRE